MKWLLVGLVLFVVWFIFIFLRSWQKSNKEKLANRLKGLIQPHSVVGITMSSRIEVSLINNDGLLEFHYRFIDGYDSGPVVISDNIAIDKVITKSFYSITDDSEKIGVISEITNIKEWMLERVRRKLHV